MDRRTFLIRSAAAAAPAVLLGRPAHASAASAAPLALVTADTEAHVGVVALHGGRLVGRIATRDGPRSIERLPGRRSIVCHAALGVITLLEGRPPRVRRVLGGFGQPRYTAAAPDGRHAFVSDSGHGEVAVVDLGAGRVVRRVAVGALARHVTLDRSGRALWVALGSSASEIVVLDVADPLHPRIARTIHPPFLAHDVGFSPSGRRVWVTAGRERRIAVYGAGGARPALLLPAGAAPQHVSFGGGFAQVASGEEPSLRVHSLSSGRVHHERRVPYGSYNVQGGAGRVLTPSLTAGTLTVLGVRGRLLHETRVAAAAHDACVLV